METSTTVDRGVKCPVCGKKHHALCHKCPHQDEVQAGRWAEALFERSPCSACQIAENSRCRHIAGSPVVTLDVYEHGEIARNDDIAAKPVKWRLAIEAVGLLSRMNPVTREIVMLRVQGEPWRDISSRVSRVFKIRMSVAAAHSRMARVARESQELADLLLPGRRRKAKQESRI